MNTVAELPRAKWSIEDYHQMIAAGILVDRRVELLRGEIIEMSPELPIHYNTTKRSTTYLEVQFAGQAEVRFNGPISLADSEPEPDIVIAQPLGRTYDHRHPYPEEIFLVIEFANTSLKKDLQQKSDIYAAAGIPEYWVVDLNLREIHVFRQIQADGLRPTGGHRYSQHTQVAAGTLTIAPFPTIVIDVIRLLP
jgi:Uma2 family endonuclease